MYTIILYVMTSMVEQQAVTMIAIAVSESRLSQQYQYMCTPFSWNNCFVSTHFVKQAKHIENTLTIK